MNNFLRIFRRTCWGSRRKEIWHLKKFPLFPHIEYKINLKWGNRCFFVNFGTNTLFHLYLFSYLENISLVYLQINYINLGCLMIYVLFILCDVGKMQNLITILRISLISGVIFSVHWRNEEIEFQTSSYFEVTTDEWVHEQNIFLLKFTFSYSMERDCTFVLILRFHSNHLVMGNWKFFWEGNKKE